jgi:hypothetical protein
MKLRCAATGKEVKVKPTPSGAPRPPRGWKRHGEQYYSPQGWQSLYLLRAITIPIVGPHGETNWPELREAMHAAWSQATSLSNWAISELSRRDVRRLPEMEKLPALDAKRAYLYPEARELFPGIPTNTVVSILNAVGGKYRKLRYDLIWRAAISLPSFRYPTPFPIHNQAWKAAWSEDERHAPLITANIGGRKLVLQLRGGVEFRRQLSAFGKIVSGEAVAGELAFYGRRVSESAHRNGLPVNGSQGEQRMQTRIMAKMVAWLPRADAPKREKQKTITLCTCPTSLLLATIEGREDPWVLNADHARRWIAQETRAMQRLREDLKAESRRSPKREVMLSRMASRSAKHNRRIDTLCHEASANLINFARRQRATHIIYDDSSKEYLPSFPWAKLLNYLTYKADEAQISFHHASAKVVSKSTQRPITAG